MSDQCLPYTHALISGMDGNRGQDEYIYILLDAQSTEEYSADNLFSINSHKSIQVATVGTGNQFLCQVADQRAFLLTFRLGEHRNKKVLYGR